MTSYPISKIVTLSDGTTVLVVPSPFDEPDSWVWQEALSNNCGHVVTLPAGREWLESRGVDLTTIGKLSYRTRCALCHRCVDVVTNLATGDFSVEEAANSPCCRLMADITIDELLGEHVRPCSTHTAAQPALPALTGGTI